ncbi:NACHT, LRR and PYD domains-containing protein 1b allele 5-like [Anolis sagrei]|uniref:NACHT, LRR and PYD domains-containing protein 1b allele 5-like n=1 Tax=Anolis sagrei TaxID=38937 RepID=UPI00352029A6
MIRDSKWDKIYRLKFTKAGSFRCCVTDLIFDVKAAVTLTYYFDSWSQHFKEEHREKWDIAGPLLNIQADSEEAVAAVHFPHFLCLEGKGCSELYLAHFVEEGMTLQKPDSVGPNHVMLKNPTFSSWGAVLEMLWLKWEKRIHAMVLLYQADCTVLKLNFYLLPNDASLRQAVNRQEELENKSNKIQKPGIMKALMIGSHFYLENMTGVTICPQKLKLEYRPPETQQQYLELFTRDMKDELKLSLKDENNEKEIVWEAFIRKEELKFTISHPLEDEKDSTDAGACRQTHKTMEAGTSSKISGYRFIDYYREELIQRAASVEQVLDRLYGTFLTNEQYQNICAKETNPKKMRELYKIMTSWDPSCKNKLYDALKDTNPYLIKDLEGK